MRHISSVAGRELRGLFVSPVAYGVLSLFAVLAGVFFVAFLHRAFRRFLPLLHVFLVERDAASKPVFVRHRTRDRTLGGFELVLHIEDELIERTLRILELDQDRIDAALD